MKLGLKQSYDALVINYGKKRKTTHMTATLFLSVEFQKYAGVNSHTYIPSAGNWK